MLSRIVDRVKRFGFPDRASGLMRRAASELVRQDSLSKRHMVRKLALIQHWEDKIKLAANFIYEARGGLWTRSSASADQLPGNAGIVGEKIHYGCGSNIVDGWLNIDLHEVERTGYRRVNLLERHPFEDSSVRFGFSEDTLEHLNQAESIFFLAEVYRTLVPNGVMRLSFPGLEGVLQRHYTPPSEKRIREGELEAYAFWGHVHFYSRDELQTVASHLGFREITFVEFGKSVHSTLSNMDTRADQIGLNIYVELTK